MKELTHQRLKQVLRYSKRTGLFTWRIRMGPRAFKGTVAGGVNHNGYGVLKIDGKSYRTGRLAWFYVNGSWPEFDIDHKNGKPADDRYVNLRDVPTYVNVQNQRHVRSDSNLGCLGVIKAKTAGKFAARIGLPTGERRWLGTFSTIKAAGRAYIEAKRRLHEGCTL